MPIYTYYCKHCNSKPEDILLPIKHCIPNCKKCNSTMIKLIQTSTLKFKGSGFYCSKKNE